MVFPNIGPTEEMSDELADEYREQARESTPATPRPVTEAQVKEMRNVPLPSPLPSSGYLEGTRGGVPEDVDVGQIYQALAAQQPPGYEHTYWEDPMRIARYDIALGQMPDNVKPHPDMPKDQIRLAAEYMKFMNNDEPWWNWQPLPEDDPGRQLLQSIPLPPNEYLAPDEVPYSVNQQAMQADLEQPMSAIYDRLMNAGVTPDMIEEWQEAGEIPQEYQSLLQEVSGSNEEITGIQQFAESILTKPARLGATIGLATSGGNPGAGAIGYGLGLAAGRNPKVGTLLMVMDYLWQGLERTVTSAGMAGALLGKGIRERPEGQSVLSAGADASAEIINNYRELWQAAQFGAEATRIPVLNAEGTYKFQQDWRKGATEAELGMDALLQIREELIAGASMEETYQKWMWNFGAEGLAKEIVAGIVLDPLNWIFPAMAVTELGQSLAKVAGGDMMAAAVKAEKGAPVAAVKHFAENLRIQYAPGGVANNMSELSAVGRMLAGVATEGHWLDDLRLKINNLDPDATVIHTEVEGPRPAPEFTGALDDLADEEVIRIFQGRPEDKPGVSMSWTRSKERAQGFGDEVYVKEVSGAEWKEAVRRTLDRPGIDVDLEAKAGKLGMEEGIFDPEFADDATRIDLSAPEKPPTTRQEYIDMRYSRRGEPTKVGRLGGAATAGAFAGALASALFGPLGAGLGGLIMAGVGYNKGFGGLVSLTPKSRAIGMANNMGNHVGIILDRAVSMKNADEAVDTTASMLRGLANTPIQIAEELSIGTIKSPEGRILPYVLKGFEKKMDTHVVAWNRAKSTIDVIELMAKVLDENPDDLFKELQQPQKAKTTLARFADQLRKVDDDVAREMLADLDQGVVTPEGLVSIVKEINDGDLPKSIDHWFGQVVDSVGRHSGEWAAEWFGVKPDIFTNRFFGAVKSVNSLLLLGLNPMYAFNNAIGDAVAAMANGVFALRSPEKIAETWKRAGITPSNLWTGIAPEAEPGLSRAGEAQAAIRKAAKGSDNITKFQEGIWWLQDKIGFASKMARGSEKWASAQSMTAAFKQFWGRMWRPGLGYDDIPPQLESALSTIDPSLPNQLREVIAMGMNADEIEAGLMRGVTRMGLDHFLPEIAPGFGMSPEDASGMLHHLGAYDFLSGRLSEAETTNDVHRAFTDLYDHVNESMLKLQEEHLDDMVNMKAQEISIEGAQAAVETLHRIYIDEYTQRVGDFQDWEKVFEQRDELTRGQFNELVNLQTSRSRNRYKRARNRWRADMLGVVKGFGYGEAFSQKIVGIMKDLEDTWNSFYEQKWGDIRKHRRTIYESKEAAQGAWVQMRKEHNDLYGRIVSQEQVMKAELDAVFVDMLGRKYGSDIAELARTRFEEIRGLREEMALNMRVFFDKMSDPKVTPAQKDKLWTQFLEREVYPGWKGKMKAELQTWDEIYEAINNRMFGGDEGAGAAPPPPKPGPEGEGPSGAPGGEPGPGQAPPAEGGPAPAPETEPQPELFGRPVAEDVESETTRITKPITTAGVVRQIASEFDLATADANGNYVAGSDIHIMNIIRKYHPDQVKANTWKSYSDLPDPQGDARKAFEMRRRLKEQQAEMQKTLEDAHREAEETAAKLEQERQARIDADEAKPEDYDVTELSTDQIRQLYELSDEDIVKEIVPFGEETPKEQAILEVQRRQQQVEMPEQEYRQVGNIQRHFDNGIEWEGIEKLDGVDDLRTLDFDAFPEGVERDLQMTARSILNMVEKTGSNEGFLMNINALSKDTLGIEAADTLDAMFGAGASMFDKMRIRKWSHPIWDQIKQLRNDGSIPRGSVINALKRIADGDYTGITERSVVEPLIREFLIDTRSQTSEVLRTEEGHAGLLYVLGEEEDAARAARQEWFREVEADTWNGSDAEKTFVAGSPEIFDYLMAKYEDLDDSRKLPDEMRLDQTEPTVDDIVQEQLDLTRAVQEWQSRKVAQKERMLRMVEDYQAVVDHPRLEPGNHRKMFEDGLIEYFNHTEEQAQALGKAWDAQARVWAKHNNSTTEYYWSHVLGFARGAGDAEKLYSQIRDKGLTNWQREAITGARKEYAVSEHKEHWNDIVLEHYGETTSPSDAGWILQDGRLVDMSGGAGQGRVFDHGEVGGILAEAGEMDPDYGMGQGMYEFMWDAGAVRMHMGGDPIRGTSLSIDISGTFSRAHQRTIKRIIREANVDEVYFDFKSFDGTNLEQGHILNPKDYHLSELFNHAHRVYASDLPVSILETPRMFLKQQGTSDLWYSKLERWAEDLPMDEMRGDQLQGMFRKAGISKDEKYWTGIRDYIESLDPDEMVSKDDVLQYVKDNKVELNETVRGRRAISAEDKALADNLHARVVDLQDRAARIEDQARHTILDLEARVGLPETQLRIFLMEPEKVYAGESYHFDADEVKALRMIDDEEITRLQTLEQKRQELQDEALLARTEAADLLRNDDAQYEKYTMPGGSDYREIILTWQPPDADVSYESGHWGQKNVIVHMRTKMRVDPDGNRVLFIEEIQSDWHQAGRKRGYEPHLTEIPDNWKIEGPTADEIASIRDDMPIEYVLLDDEGVTQAVVNFRARDFELRDVKQELLRNYREGIYIPEAPWSKSWDELAFKRILRYAAEENVDKIAWTTGKQQAKRYPVDVKWEESNIYDWFQEYQDRLYPDAGGRVDVPSSLEDIKTHHESHYYNWLENNPDAKIVKLGSGGSYRTTLLVTKPDDLLRFNGFKPDWVDHTWEAIQGSDDGVINPLERGMSGFYDRILGYTAGKIGKDWDVEPYMGRVWASAEEGELIYKVAQDRGGGWRIMERGRPRGDSYPDRASAEAAYEMIVGEMYADAHMIDLTDEIRQSAQEPQRLLQDNFAGAKGAIEMFSDGKALFRAFDGADFSTMVHESFHFFRQMLSEDDITTWLDWSKIEQKGSRIWEAKNSDMRIKKVGDQYFYDGTAYDSLAQAHTVLSEEMFARAGERYFAEGVAPTTALQGVFQMFKEWMMEVYQVLKGSDIDIEITDEMRELFDGMFDDEYRRVMEDGQIAGMLDKQMSAEMDTPLFTGNAAKGVVEPFKPEQVGTGENLPGFERAYTPDFKPKSGLTDIDKVIRSFEAKIDDIRDKVLRMTDDAEIEAAEAQIRNLEEQIKALQDKQGPQPGQMFQRYDYTRFERRRELISKAEEAFPKTWDYEKAGFIMPDGTMLGIGDIRHSTAVARIMDLGAGSEVVTLGGFLRESGLIRMGLLLRGFQDELYVQMEGMPSRSQMDALRGLEGEDIPLFVVFNKDGNHVGTIDDQIFRSSKDLYNQAEAIYRKGRTLTQKSSDWTDTDNGPRRVLPQFTEESEAAFWSWFGDGQVLDDQGKQPKMLYHGTPRDFEAFDPTYMNPESYYGRGIYLTDNEADATGNYNAYGPDWGNKIEIASEEMMWKIEDDVAEVANYIAQAMDNNRKVYGETSVEDVIKIWENEGPEWFAMRDDLLEEAVMFEMGINPKDPGRVMPLYTNAENVLDVDNQKFRGGVEAEFTREDFESDAEYQDYLAYDATYGIYDQDGNFYDLYNAIRRASYEFQYGPDFGDIMAALEDEFGFVGEWHNVTMADISDLIRSDPNLYFRGAEGGFVSGQFLQHVIRNMGFDGIKMDAEAAFTGKGMGGTMGMSDVYGTSHYVVFEPENVKSIHNRGTWDPGSRNIFYQKSDGSFDDLRSDGEMPEPIGMKRGAYDEAAKSFAPSKDMSYEAWEEKVYPMLRALEERIASPDAKVANRISDIDIPEETGRQLNQYIERVKGQQAETKYAGIRQAKVKRDAALLNYQRRLGIDNVTEALLPYQFYYTRAGLNWLANFANRPALLAHYARIRSDEKKLGVAQPGFPQRLLNKVGVPVPFLPKWAQGKMYVDPLHNAFQFEQFFRPFNEKQERKDQLERQAMYVVEGYYNKGEITLEEAQEAYTTRDGEVWQRALYDAQERLNDDQSNPMDFVELMTGYSLPLQVMSDAMKGEKANTGMLPFSRLVQAATAWQKPGGMNIEKGIRTFLGWPEKDQWNGIYYPIRELGNMVIDENLPIDEARRAMIEQKGPVWQAAVDRAGKYQALKYWGSVFWADFFPEGEEKQRALQQEFSKAIDSGERGAVNEFFEEYPEYEARMAVFDWEDPEEMLRQYFISQVWDRYLEANDTAQSEITDRLGEEFQMLFLNKETRNYAGVPTETLQRWAQGLGTRPLDIEDGEAVQGEQVLSPQEQAIFQQFEESREVMFGETTDMLDTLGYISSQLPPDKREEFLRRFPQLQKMSDWETMYQAQNPEIIDYIGSAKVRDADLATQQLYASYNAERLRRFPSDLFDVQEAFFDIEGSNKRKKYLKQHPELKAYWEWRGEVLEQFPTLAPYIDSVESIGRSMELPKIPAVDVSAFQPALLRQLLGYYKAGQEIGSGATRLLYETYEKGGYPEPFEEWLDTTLKESMDFYLNSQ